MGAQVAAALFVVGSYVAAEAVRKRRRARVIMAATSVASKPAEVRLPAVDHVAEPVATR